VGASGYEESPAGRPADVEFVHVGARWYDPSTGRFLQRDPLGIEGGLNVYAYVDGCPTSLVDPRGELAWVGIVIHTAIQAARTAGQQLCWSFIRRLPVTLSGHAIDQMK